jgi:hypothetical protein
MDLTVDNIFDQIMGAAEASFKDGWSAVKDYAPVEFKKMAVQIEDIASNVLKHQADPTKGYSEETAKVLWQMQRHACEGVLVAVTKLTLIAVQNALNAIIDVVKKVFKGILGSVL